jgi:hypothetical protein
MYTSAQRLREVPALVSTIAAPNLQTRGFVGQPLAAVQRQGPDNLDTRVWWDRP